MATKRVDSENVIGHEESVDGLVHRYNNINRLELLKKIEIISQLVNDPSFDVSVYESSEYTDIVKQFVHKYPSPNQQRKGLKALYNEYYKL